MPSSARQRPSCSLALWQTNSSPLSENKWAHSSGGSHWQTRGRSTALMPARAQGSGCLDLRSSSAPLSAPTLLHLLSLEGNWRQTRVGELRAPWQGANGARMGHRCIRLHGSSGQSHRAWWPDREQQHCGAHRCPQRHAVICSALNPQVFQPLLSPHNGCLVNTATELPWNHFIFCLHSDLVTRYTVYTHTHWHSGTFWTFGEFPLMVDEKNVNYLESSCLPLL